MVTKQLTPQELNVCLLNMVGKTYKYANKTLTVNSAKCNLEEEELYLDTDQGLYKSPFARAATFLSFWHLVEGTEVPTTDAAIPQPPVPQAYSNTDIVLHPEIQKMDTTADYLITELKDSISKVKQNAGYVNQAKVVNAAVNSIINVKRTQLEMYKAVSGKK